MQWQNKAFELNRYHYMNIEKEYEFGTIRIVDEEIKEGPIRTLYVNDGKESSCFTDEGRHFDLRYAYNYEFVQMLFRTVSDRRVLLIGGAGFSLPKCFISAFPTGSMDVVELHPEMYDIAMEYFFLDELYDKYHPDRTGRLNVIFDDGSDHIEKLSRSLKGSGSDEVKDKKYDLLLDDAFLGMISDEKMLSEHTVSCICDILKPDGIFAANIISPTEGYGSMKLTLAKSTFENHFREVRLWQVDPDRDPKDNQNCILYAKNPLID